MRLNDFLGRNVKEEKEKKGITKKEANQ